MFDLVVTVNKNIFCINIINSIDDIDCIINIKNTVFKNSI